jgi:uncharacterized protein
MNPGRRAFLRTSLILGSAAVPGKSVVEQAAPTPALQEAELLARMSWMNEPASSKLSGTQLLVHSRPKTDFWRKTFYGYVTDNGHFFHLPAPCDFTFLARVNGQYAALYDQAGLMVRLDAENWMKCGPEFSDGRRHASVVFTRDFSDWSSLDGKNFTSVRQGYFPPGIKAEVGVMCAAPEGPGFDAVFDSIRLENA